MRYILDGSKMISKADAYAEIMTVLEAPDYMGANLDALNDILGEVKGEIVLIHACKMLSSLEKYGCRMLEVFFDAAHANADLTFTLGMAHNEPA